MIAITRLEDGPTDICMCWIVHGTIDGVPFSGELSRDNDYVHVSGPEPDFDTLNAALNESPLFAGASSSLPDEFDGN